jgi:hypothetical protein
MTLEHLDTIISFVAILTGVSLLATILTQMVSSLLGLRGINLRWGIATLLEHADPKLGKYARDIAHEVLTHSVISDSMFADAESALVQNWQLASGITDSNSAHSGQTGRSRHQRPQTSRMGCGPQEFPGSTGSRCRR